MKLFFSIWEFRSQQISSSTENIYLVNTSVIFTIPRHHGCIEGGTMKENFITYVDGIFTGPIVKEFYVHSGSFKSVWMLCIEGECLRWCGAVMAMIYRAPWKSHECPTGDLSIPEVEPYLCDENKIAPTQISSLYAFLTLAHKAWKAHHHLKRFLRDELQSLLPWGLYLKWNDA